MRSNEALSPIRAALFYSVNLFCLITAGSYFQQRFQLLGTALMEASLFLGLAVLFALLLEQRPLKEIFRLRLLTVRGLLKSCCLGILGWGLAQVLSLLMLTLLDLLGGQMPSQYEQLMAAPYPTALLVGAVVPAISEEAAFRGYILTGLRPLGRTAAVVLTGVLFGLMHLSLVRALPLITLGLLFAAAVERTGSILPSILMHFLNNAIAISLTFLTRDAFNQSAAAGTAKSSASQILTICGMALVLAAAAWAVLQRLGPDDVLPSNRAPGAADVPTADHPSAATPLPDRLARQRWMLVLGLLLPAVLIFLWAAASELVVVLSPAP